MGQKTTLASWVLSICKSGEHYGVDPSYLMKVANLDIASQNISEDRVPVDAMEHVWATLVEKAQDESVGLTAASYITPMTFHAMAMTIQSSATVRDALSTMQKHLSVIHDGIWIEVEDGPDSSLNIILRQEKECLTPSEQTVDAGVAIYFKIFTQWMGLMRHNVLAVQFTRATPPDSTNWQMYFGVPLKFSSKHSGLTLSNGALDFPISSGNRDLKSIGESALEKYRGSYEKPIIERSIRRTLKMALEQGESPNQDFVAQTLAISSRSLRRMLGNINTTYSRIWDDVRRENAEHLLTTTDLPISEVAWRLGIENVSTFNRLFKAWSSCSPSEFRKRLNS